MAKRRDKKRTAYIVISILVVVLAFVYITWIAPETPETQTAPAATEKVLTPEEQAAAEAASASTADREKCVSVEIVDIGIGDGIIIQYPTGETMVVDTGEALDVHFLLDALAEKKIAKIDYLVLTHPHTDHIGGAQAVLDAYMVDRVIMPDAEHTTSTYEKLLTRLVEEDYEVEQAYAGKTMDIGEAHLEFISPIKDEEYDNPNEYSAVFILSFGKTKMMFTGDMETPNESAALAAGYDVDVDIVKVAHHGSQTSSGAKWVKAMSPDYALISCYGPDKKTPNTKIVERYEEQETTVVRTDLVGDIYVYIGDEGYEVVAMNNTHERRVDD